jgi:HemY protein
MLEHKETEYLDARYLSESATKQHQLPKARELAQRAQSLNPAGIPALLSLHIQLEEWQQGAIVVNRAVRKGQVSRQQQRHYNALLHTQHAIQLLDDGLIDTSLAVARRAIAAKSEFTPARQVYIRALLAHGQHAKANRQIMSWWKQTQNPLLAELFHAAIGPLTRDSRLKQVRKLAALRPDSYESHMAVAQVAISCGEWRMARDALKKALHNGDTALACKRMAEVEQGEYSDYDAAARWLTRSTTAAASPSWICTSCGTAATQWSSHCPRCESFDTLEWKARDISFTAA